MLFYDYLLGQDKLHGEIRHVASANLETQSSVKAIEGVEDKKLMITGGEDGNLYLWDVGVATDVNGLWTVKQKVYNVQDPLKPEIIHAQYYEQSDYFVTADVSKWVKIYKISDPTLLAPLSKIEEAQPIVTIKAIHYSNKLFVATKDTIRIRNSNVLNCHFFC